MRRSKNQPRKEISEAFKTVSKLFQDVFGKKLSRKRDDDLILFYTHIDEMNRVIDDIKQFIFNVSGIEFVENGENYLTKNGLDVYLFLIGAEEDDDDDSMTIYEVRASRLNKRLYLPGYDKREEFMINVGFLLTMNGQDFFPVVEMDFDIDYTEDARYISNKFTTELPNKNNYYGRLLQVNSPSVPIYADLLRRIDIEIGHAELPLTLRVLDIDSISKESERTLVSHLYLTKPLPLVPSSYRDKNSLMYNLMISAYMSFEVYMR